MNRFHGIFTPLVTPINADESPDLGSLERLVQFQLEAGVHGLWAMGTSGEFASFDENERAAAIETVVRSAGGTVPVIANISDASTRLTIRHGKRALAAGADAVAATPPYYYPHSQDELLDHYRRIREAVDLPLYIYNIPQTVRVKVELPTARTLVQEGTTSGVKDSQNDFEWLRQVARFVRQKSLPFTVFAGTRFLIDAAVQIGADGAIPSLANAYPAQCVAAYEAAAAGDFNRAVACEEEIMHLEGVVATVRAGSRNAVILGYLKAVLADRGVISRPDLTSPLRTPGEEETATMLREAATLDAAGV